MVGGRFEAVRVRDSSIVEETATAAAARGLTTLG
jgi:hypothetical protein